MRSATLSGFGQGAGPALSVRFEPPEFDPPQAVASRVIASTMNEEQRLILASLGVRDTLRGHFAEESCRRLRVDRGVRHPSDQMEYSGSSFVIAGVAVVVWGSGRGRASVSERRCLTGA